MADDPKWKTDLLSSGLPLECQHARPNVAWFFLPDLNRPHDSPAAAGRNPGFKTA